MSDTKTPILQVRDITRDYITKAGMFGGTETVQALKGIDFDLIEGETLALVGESGCGKSTLARILTMIDAQTSGELVIQDKSINIAKHRVTPEMRRTIQIVFQNPYGSLNPRQKVGGVLEEPLIINHSSMSAGERRDRAMEMLLKVGLEPVHYGRYPHMFSGGQRQRIAIGRALMLRPKILVLDEPVSALDLSIQAQILNLLKDLQDEFNLSYLFISHDLSVVKYLADRVMVMYYGEIVEHGSRDAVFDDPQHDYTKTLLSATPQTSIEAIRARVMGRQANA